MGKRFSNSGFREYPLEYLRALSSGGSACAVAYSRQRGSSEDIQIALDVTAIEATAGKEVRVIIPESHETITAKIPAGARDGMRLRFKGKGRPGKSGERSGDFYILLSVK